MDRPGLKTSEFWLLMTGLAILVANGTPYLSLTALELGYVMALVGGGYAVRTVKKSKPLPNIVSTPEQEKPNV